MCAVVRINPACAALLGVPSSPAPQNPLSPQQCGIRMDDLSPRNSLFPGNGVASSQAMLHPQPSIPAHTGRAGQSRAAHLLLVILTKPAKFNSSTALEQRQCLSCVPALQFGRGKSCLEMPRPRGTEAACSQVLFLWSPCKHKAGFTLGRRYRAEGTFGFALLSVQLNSPLCSVPSSAVNSLMG